MNPYTLKTPQEQYYTTKIRPIVQNRKFGRNDDPSEILDGFLWLGDSSNAMDMDQLKSYGITCVVNCAARDTLTTREYYPLTWEYKEYEANDNPEYNLLAEHLDDFVKYVDECRKKNKRVLVHCVAGINRSVTLCVAYLVIREKMTLEEAIRHCFKARPIILTNMSFAMQLIERFVKL